MLDEPHRVTKHTKFADGDEILSKTIDVYENNKSKTRSATISSEVMVLYIVAECF